MWFSIAMSNYQRVSPTENNYFLELFQASAPLSLRVETPRQPGCGNTKWWHQIELRKNYTMVQQKDKWRYYWAKKGCINMYKWGHVGYVRYCEILLGFWDSAIKQTRFYYISYAHVSAVSACPHQNPAAFRLPQLSWAALAQSFESFL